jgi:hypothetical protein
MLLTRISNKTKKIIRRIQKSLLQIKGPTMTSVLTLSDAVFLAKFNVDGILSLLKQGDTMATRDILLNHYERRISCAWPSFQSRIQYKNKNVIELSPEELQAEANLLVDRRFSLLGQPEISLDEPIDWLHNPTPDPRARWTRELSRFQWLPILALAYDQYGEERYAETFVHWMMSWIQKNPPPRYKCERDPIWGLMNVGLRCLSWVSAFGTFYNAPAFTPETKLAMLRSFYDHARFLFLYSTNRNHLLMETNGLLFLSTHLPEFKEAHQWQQTALERFERELAVQISNDGSQCEVSTHYQWEVAGEYEAVYNLMQSHQLSMPHTNLSSWIEKMYHFLTYIARPDSSWPDLNDGFLSRSERLQDKLRKAGTKFKRDDFIYVATKGLNGTVPTQTSVGFHDAGLYVMRSDWHREARYLIFDAGPYGGPHGHEDKLSFELFAFGQPFIVDPGTYTYNATDPFRLYFMGSQGHNTILVDGLSQVRRWQPGSLWPQANKGNDVTWISHRDFDYAVSTYSGGYGTFSLKKTPDQQIIKDVFHTRRVLFAKPDYWIILDELQTTASHKYQLLFHTAPDISASSCHNHSVVLMPETGTAQLFIVSAAHANPHVSFVTGQTKPIQGWFSDDRMHKIPTTTVVHEWSRNGTIVIATLLYPCSQTVSADCIGLDQLAVSGGQGWAFHVQIPNYSDYVLFSKDTDNKQFGSYQCSEMLYCIRTDSQNNKKTEFSWSESLPHETDQRM